jgi:hypothetical protein
MKVPCRSIRADVSNSVETLHSVETPHVYRMFYFHPMQSFHDLRHFHDLRPSRVGPSSAAPSKSRVSPAHDARAPVTGVATACSRRTRMRS